MGSEKQNSNDSGAETRLALVKTMLREVFGFESCHITPVAYEEGFPFPYNNFVYAIEVGKKTSSRPLPGSKQPGTHIIPFDFSTFIFRLSNPISGYNDKVRVENEVAALSLAREALQPSLAHLVPRVFGWASAKNGEGWVLMERMSGEGLIESFESMDTDSKSNILGQMADVLACFQRFKLPETIDKYGGLTFNSNGEYVSSPLSIFDAGPFETYEDLLLATIRSKLEQADADPRVKGWQDNNIRSRLEAYLSDGIPSLLRNTSLPDKILVHADFSIDNVLYDRETKKITAVFDFDFAHIGSVADDFFRSLGHGIGRFPDTRDGDEEMTNLHYAMLHGFPNPLPINTEQVDWAAAKAWDDALRDRNMQRPATISGIASLADIFWLSSQILPFKLCNKVVVGNSTEDQLSRRKNDGEALLSGFLSEHGF